MGCFESCSISSVHKSPAAMPSSLKLFAKDTKPYRAKCCEEDQQMLKVNIFNANIWSKYSSKVEIRQYACLCRKMAVNVHSGCYCCSVSPAKMDIDAALDELGMLSTVTQSRKQFMQERLRTRSESALLKKHKMHPKTHSLPVSSASSSYQIVHLDPKYITGISDTPNSTEMKSDIKEASQSQSDEVFLDFTKDFRTQTENIESTIDERRKLKLKFKREDISARNRRILARKRAKQPYEVPWRLTQSFQESMLSRQDDVHESKSTSSSPVKPLNPDSLTRSRSLDNIDFSAFFVSDNQDRQDVDNVASGLKNLKFSDS